MRCAVSAAAVLVLIAAAGWASTAAAAQEDERWHELVLDESLDRRGATWPPALSQEEKAEIMLPEAMKARMLWAAEEGARRKLLVREAATGSMLGSNLLNEALCEAPSCHSFFMQGRCVKVVGTAPRNAALH